MRKFLTDNFAKIGLAVLVLLTAVLVAVFLVPKVQFSAKAKEHINIFPSDYSIESVGDIAWQNPENAFNQNLPEGASLTDFNDNNSAFIQGTNYIPVTTTNSTIPVLVDPTESTTTTISNDTIPTTTISEETTTISTITTTTTTTIVPATTTTLSSETTTTTAPIEASTTTTTLPPETTTTLPPETTTTVPLSFIRNIFSFLISGAKAEETTTTVTEPTTTTLPPETTTTTIPIETTTTTTVPVEVTTTETLPTTTTLTTIEETTTTTSTSTTTVPAKTITTTTIPTQTASVTIPNGQEKDTALSSLIISNFDLGEEAFNQMVSQKVQLRVSLASQGQSDGKVIVSFFYHDEWQNLGEIDLTQEVSNSKNGGYFLYALPIFENFEEFQNFKVKFQVSGTNIQKIFLDAVWIEADYEKIEAEPPEIETPKVPLPSSPLKERKLEKIVNLEKGVDYNCKVIPFQIDISNLSSTEVKINLTRGRNKAIDEIEIGSLPSGIDLKFKSNTDYIYQPAKEENDILLLITKEEGAQKGSFSIPIIYTKKDSDNYSTLCQINIVNQ